MKKLLKFEFSKLIRAKVFYICLAVSALWIVLNIVIIPQDLVKTTGFIRGYASCSSLVLMLSICIPCFVCQDSFCGAEKTILGRGVSRNKFFFAKYISSLVATIIYTLIVVGLSAIAGVIKFNHGVDETFVQGMLLSLLGVLMIHGIFFGVSTISGKLIIAIIITIFLPSTLSLVAFALDYFIPIDNFTFSIISPGDALGILASYTEMNLIIGWSIATATVLPAITVAAAREVYIRKEC